MTTLKLSQSARKRLEFEGNHYGPSPYDYVPEMAAQALERPSNSSWSDDDMFTTHTQMFAYSPLADDLFGESNYETILAALQDEFPGESRVSASSFGHWTYAHFSAIKIRVLDKRGRITPEFAVAAVIARGLADEYPVFDESDYSEREWKASEGAFKSELEWLSRNVELTDAETQAIYEIVAEKFGTSDPGYVDPDWITEAAQSLHIALEETE